MGNCCAKPLVFHDLVEREEAHNRMTIIMHAYKDLPDEKQGTYSRKRRGSFVMIEHSGPQKRVRTNEMVACLEGYLNTTQNEKDKN